MALQWQIRTMPIASAIFATSVELDQTFVRRNCVKCFSLATRSSRSRSTVPTLRRIFPFALGLLSLSTVSLMPIHPAFAQEEAMRRTLTVTGQGSEFAPTTLSQVTLGVEVQGETAATVQQEVAQRSAALVELLRSRNVTKLQTAGLYLSPIYDYNDSSPRITGYTATNTVSFQVPTTEAGVLMDAAIQAGATRIDGVSFIADDAAINTARQQAIREATEDARAQADAAFDALGLTAGDIVSVQVNGAYAYPPMPYYGRTSQVAEAAVPTPVIGGEQEVQANVTLEISY